MYLFLSAGIGKNLTGIEHAILRRGGVFNACGLAYKIVTLNYNPNYKKNISLHGIRSEDFLNLYDSFQGLIFLDFKDNSLQGFLSKVSGEIRIDKLDESSDVKVYVNDIYAFYIHLFEDGQISYINYFDNYHVKFKREIYTEHGWLSKIIYLENNSPKHIHYIDCNLNVVLEEYCGKEKSTSLYILSHLNKKHFFNDQKEIIKYWLGIVISSYKNPVLYSDKNKIYNDVLISLKTTKFKLISIFHSVHVSNPKQIEKGRINLNYVQIFDNINKFDGFIVSTERQKQDLQNRFGGDLRIWVIPPAYADISPSLQLSNEQFIVISVGRYYVEKRLHHIIEAVEVLKQKYPEIELHLYGFGDARDNFAYEKKIRTYVMNNNLQRHIYFKGYVQNIAKCISGAHVSVMTSTIEGFCIGILDSLSVGTPVVAYDIKYGPADMLESAYSGYLVEEENISELAVAIEQCYLNTWMRKNAVESIQRYSLNSLKKKWLDHILELSDV